MNKITKAFCRAVLLLEHIPAYRRLIYVEIDDEDNVIKKRETHWRYLRHGLWGFNLLDRLNLFDKYMGTSDWEEVDEPGEDGQSASAGR